MRRFLGFFVFALVSCAQPAAKVGPVWKPGTIYPSSTSTVRGFRDVRGLVHSHSVYSHDACDGKPVLADGSRDPVCFEDFRRGLCQSQHDFAFLTDHKDAFDDVEFPDAVLYRPDQGDVLIDGRANRITCDDGHTAIIMAGNEGGFMPVGVESHAVDGHDARDALYGAQTADAEATLQQHGAVVLLAHPEQFSVDELFAMPIEGFEMYNLHANTLLGAGGVLDVLVRWTQGDKATKAGIMDPNLLVLDIWSEDPRYLTRWGNVLARGKHVVTTMGTDCHRNTFPTVMADGERADSYRRMMIAFSNHLRVTGDLDDRALKEALHAGRNWGAFEMMGYPVGFDSFSVDDSGKIYEMGETAPKGARLVVVKPTIENLDPSREKPKITLRILRATDDPAGFAVVATSTGDKLEAVMDAPGAYRAEVRMMPLHLRQDMRDDATALLDEKIAKGEDYVWVYGGALYAQ